MIKTIQNISNYTAFTNSMNNFYNLKKDMYKNQERLSSGMKATNYVELSNEGIIEGTIDNNNKIVTYSSFIKSNEFVLQKIETMNQALTSVIGRINDFRSSVVAKISANSAFVDLTADGKSTLGIIQENLNAKFQGKYLFGGSVTNTPPVNNIVNNSNIINGKVSPNYYRGDSVISQAKISEEIVMNYGITANHPTIQQAIASIHMAIGADKNGKTSELLEAMTAISNAIQDLTKLRSNINYNSSQIEKNNDNITALREFYYNAQSANLSADIPAETLEFENNQLILVGLYKVNSRLSKLNYADYL